jgi:membrane-associated progesterone receptor component
MTEAAQEQHSTTTPTTPTQLPGGKDARGAGDHLPCLTPAQLAQHDGSDPTLPLWLAIKGQVFDVSSNAPMYAPGKGYAVFVGKDVSRALGKSSLAPEDCIPDTSTLTPEELGVLDKWVEFFVKKYPVVGRVVDANGDA